MQLDLSAMESEQHISISILLFRVNAALLLPCGPAQNVKVKTNFSLPHRFIFDLFRLKVSHMLENIIMNGFDLQTNVRKILINYKF